jgi:hypothetical protein
LLVAWSVVEDEVEERRRESDSDSRVPALREQGLDGDPVKRSRKGLRRRYGRAIITDAGGRPIDKPRRADYSSDTAYIRAFHVYKDKIARVANEAFDAGFRAAMRRGGRP